jgi:hypothetical protein
MMSPNHEAGREGRPAMEDLLFGLFLLGVAVLVLVSTRKLSIGTASDMGPGYVPQAIAWGMALFGIFFVGKSFAAPGKKVHAPYWRGLILISAAVGVFALFVNTAGLALASFLAMITVSLASKETRLIEVMIFSALISAASVLLFVKALSLPVPIFPW